MSDTELQDLKYSLAKRVPAMMRGFVICTNYGDIFVDEEWAEPFRNLAFDVLMCQLNQQRAARALDE